MAATEPDTNTPDEPEPEVPSRRRVRVVATLITLVVLISAATGLYFAFFAR